MLDRVTSGYPVSERPYYLFLIRLCTARDTLKRRFDSGDTIAVTGADIQATQLGLASLDVTTIGTSESSLASLDAAINTINTTRGDLGAAQNRMTSALTSILNARENLSAAESRIRDVDVAAETADLTRNSIMQQASVSVLQQANVQPQIALSLLQG